MKGTRPAFCLGRVFLDERDGRMGSPMGAVADEFGFLTAGEENQEGKLSRRSSLGKSRNMNERLVAIKITPRRTPGSTKEEEERTRVRFVREVEVLKVIRPRVLLGCLEAHPDSICSIYLTRILLPCSHTCQAHIIIFLSYPTFLEGTC